MTPPPIDFGALADLIGTDDANHLREVARLFATSSARMLTRVQECQAAGDVEGLRVAAHGWKGSAVQVCAAPLAEALARVETSLPKAADAIAEVERRFTALSAWV